MPLTEEIMTDGGVRAVAGLIRWVVICTITVCVAVLGAAFEVSASLEVLSSKTEQYQKNNDRRVERIENKLDSD